eukprot:gene8285-11061_t
MFSAVPPVPPTHASTPKAIHAEPVAPAKPPVLPEDIAKTAELWSMIQSGNAAEPTIRRAIIVGNFEAAVECCLEAGLMAEALLLARDFDASATCLEQAEGIVGDPLATARGAELRIQWLIAQERTEEAFQAGLVALARIGLDLRPERAAARSVWELLRLKAVLRGRPPATWAYAEESHEAHHVQTQRLIFATVSVSHAYAPSLYA